jgi:hypothetical protein
MIKEQRSEVRHHTSRKKEKWSRWARGEEKIGGRKNRMQEISSYKQLVSGRTISDILPFSL